MSRKKGSKPKVLHARDGLVMYENGAIVDTRKEGTREIVVRLVYADPDLQEAIFNLVVARDVVP